VPDVDLDDIVAAAASGATEAPDMSLEAALRQAVRGDPATLSAHLTVLERDIAIGTTQTRLHCYFLPVDGNGRVRFKPLAEFLRDRIIDYAIPRRTIEEALRLTTTSGSAVPFSKLHERARQLFTDLAQSGEGGELLLFAMAEAIFGLTQIICKMTLKTSPSMHYHGSDGVYAEGRPDGGLNLYWGESKIYADPAAAIRECLASLAPFLVQPDGADAQREQDILLLNEFANLTDQRLIDGLKRFLDRDDPHSLQTRHCGIALAAFDSAAYPAADVEAIADKIAAALRDELGGWSQNVQRRIAHEKLERFNIHFTCIPVPSAEDFRQYFLQMLGAQA
jgi:hypothetical protein